jgi:hypothetical protein
MGISKKRLECYSNNIENLHIKIPWRYFVPVMKKSYGFEVFSGGRTSGATRLFVNGNVRFNADEPHSREATVDRASRMNAIRSIQMLKVKKEGSA